MDFTTKGMDKLILVATLIITAFFYLKNKIRPALPYPPGPKKLPLLGNLLVIPTSFDWKVYAQWGKEYNSDIIHLHAAGRDIIVLNSFAAATALLDKKSSIYSSRPQSNMLNEMVGWKWLFSSMEYGGPWRDRRRLFQTYFSNRNIDVHQSIQLEFVRNILPQLRDTPEEFLSITQHLTGGVALSLAYGLKIKDRDDPFVDLAVRAFQTINDVSTPTALIFDLIPWLQYVPAWVPGAGFQKRTSKWRKLQVDFHEKPYAEAVKNIGSGKGKLSLTSQCLENLDEKSDLVIQKQLIQDSAGIVFAAGSDTTSSAIHTFFVAMLYYPEAQKKAQEELDRVLGGRLPEFQDEPNLPYVSALAKETLRWKALAPGGVPHCVTEDDTYEGYHIPKNSIVIGNIGAMLYDEKDYPNPSIFQPERFLKANGELNPAVRDPTSITFGFGRRACPGNQIAKSILWLTAATVLTVFDISKAVDEDGIPVEPSVEYGAGLTVHPKPFKCTIKPRSALAEELIKYSEEES